MGVLLKVVLFGLVFYYIFKTVGNFVIRILGGQAPPQQRQRQNYQAKREGEINIDYNPRKQKTSRPKKASDDEYIDFEEVK